jgi:hypothetical protein
MIHVVVPTLCPTLPQGKITRLPVTGATAMFARTWVAHMNMVRVRPGAIMNQLTA